MGADGRGQEYRVCEVATARTMFSITLDDIVQLIPMKRNSITAALDSSDAQRSSKVGSISYSIWRYSQYGAGGLGPVCR